MGALGLPAHNATLLFCALGLGDARENDLDFACQKSRLSKSLLGNRTGTLTSKALSISIDTDTLILQTPGVMQAEKLYRRQRCARPSSPADHRFLQSSQNETTVAGAKPEWWLFRYANVSTPGDSCGRKHQPNLAIVSSRPRSPSLRFWFVAQYLCDRRAGGCT